MTIRFPSGALTERVPDVGDTLVREGTTRMVAAVTESVDHHRVITMALPPEVQN
jgi:hypothetical protein